MRRTPTETAATGRVAPRPCRETVRSDLLVSPCGSSYTAAESADFRISRQRGFPGVWPRTVFPADLRLPRNQRTPCTPRRNTVPKTTLGPGDNVVVEIRGENRTRNVSQLSVSSVVIRVPKAGCTTHETQGHRNLRRLRTDRGSGFHNGTGAPYSRSAARMAFSRPKQGVAAHGPQKDFNLTN